MGRLGPNQPPETIDDALPPPIDHDLYEPPSNNYQKPSVTKNVQQRSPAQSFPPAPQQDEAQQFPPPHQYHTSPEETTQSFPPVQNPAADQHYYHQPNHVQFQQQQHVFSQTNSVLPNINNGAAAQMGNHPAAMSSPYNQFNNNPANQMQNQIPTQAWSSSLFDCMNDPENAIITAFFPCVTFGQIAEIVDSGGTSCGSSGMLYGVIAFCIAVPCIMSCAYRTKMRSRFGLIESPAPDWIVHCFCEWCALCQEYRELKARDLDPSIGWLGNVAKQQQKQQFAMAPPMQQRMM